MNNFTHSFTNNFTIENYAERKSPDKIMGELSAIFTKNSVSIENLNLVRKIRDENLQRYFTAHILKRNIAFLSGVMEALAPILVKKSKISQHNSVERKLSVYKSILQDEGNKISQTPHYLDNPVATMMYEYCHHYINLYSDNDTQIAQAQTLTMEIPRRLQEMIENVGSVRGQIEKSIWQFRQSINQSHINQSLRLLLQDHEHEIILGLFENLLHFSLPNALMYAPTKTDEFKVKLAKTLHTKKASREEKKKLREQKTRRNKDLRRAEKSLTKKEKREKREKREKKEKVEKKLRIKSQKKGKKNNNNNKYYSKEDRRR